MTFACLMRPCLVAVAVLLGLPACGPKETGKRPVLENEPPRGVQVARVESRAMERVIKVTGTLVAQEQSTLSAKVPGRLLSISVDVGTVVKKGDLLATVEPADYELRFRQSAAAVSQARAELGLPLEGEDDRMDPDSLSTVKQAKAVLDEAASNRGRINSLTTVGVASQSERDTVEANYAVALTRYEGAREQARTLLAALAQKRAELEIVRKQLTDTAIRAPFDGVVQTRQGSLGEYLAAGTPVVTLVQADPLRLRLEIPERDAILVRSNQAARVHVEGMTNAAIGRIVRLSPAMSELTRTLLVEADVPNKGYLRPGQFARAEIIVNEGEAAVSVPTACVVTFAGIEKIIIVQEGKALEKIITTGRRGAGWVEVTSGLAAGTLVALDPVGLRTGQPLVVTDRAPDVARGRTQSKGSATAPATK